MLELRQRSFGDYGVNCYLLISPDRSEAFLVDPGAEAEAILDWVGDLKISRIFITHGHRDHVEALEEVRQGLKAPVGIHPADAEKFELQADFDLQDGDEYALSGGKIDLVHLPGHTPGQVGLRLIEGGQFNCVVVGDAIFPGGPGATASNDALAESIETLARTVFTWPDATHLHPGHGEAATVGAERAAFEAFRAQPLPPDLQDNVTWED